MWILLLTVLAQDFDTLYHDAYVLEVVDGKPADAARAYLDLLRSADLPAPLRAQCRFRFAVTCALLGRPDEARAQLAELAADETLPKGLAASVAEYRKALEGAGMGSELEKRMQELVFGLGRADPTEPAEYRDFEIIGAPAIPFLRSLMKHTDRALREHAFRLLCRMDVGGLGGLWEREWDHCWPDLAAYLTRNPAEARATEERILGLPRDDAGNLLAQLSTVPCFSDEFLDQVAPWSADAVAGASGRRRLAFWIREGRKDVGLAAVRQWDNLLAQGKVGEVDAETYTAALRRLVGDPNVAHHFSGFGARAKPEQALAAFEGLLAAAEKGPVDDRLFQSVLIPVFKADVDPARLSSLLERWIAVGKPEVIEWSLPYYGAILGKLPQDVQKRVVSRAVGGRVTPNILAQFLALLEPGGVPRLIAALEAPETRLRRDLANVWLKGLERSLGREYRQAVMDRAEAVVAALPDDSIDNFISRLPMLAADLDPARARAAALLALRRVDERRQFNAATYLSDAGALAAEERRAWQGRVIVPLLPDLAQISVQSGYSPLPLAALNAVAKAPPLDDEAKRGIADFLRTHPEIDLDYRLAGMLGSAYPPEEWIGFPGGQKASTYIKRGQEADRVARALATGPAGATEGAVRFIRDKASPEVARETLSALLDRATPEQMDRFAGCTDVDPARLRARLLQMCTQRDAPARAVAALGLDLARRAPSEDLFPVVDWLVKSGNKQAVLKGIDLARSLGREELLPSLRSLIDSMDVDVRTGATAAIDSILQLRKLKQDVSARIAESKLLK